MDDIDKNPGVANVSGTAQSGAGTVEDKPSPERVAALAEKWKARPDPEGMFTEMPGQTGVYDPIFDEPLPAPTLGRIVRYTLNDDDCAQINTRRVYNRKPDNQPGHPVGMHHVGKTVFAGQTFPMMVVGEGEHGVVDGQVFLNGNDTLWVEGVGHGGDAGQYQWPQRV